MVKKMGKNLVQNPSFENVNSIPHDWWNYESIGFSGALEIVDDALTGTKAVKVINDSPEAVGAWAQTIILPKGTKKISFGGYTKQTVQSNSGIGYVAIIVDCFSSPETGFTWLGTVETIHEYDTNDIYHKIEAVSVLPTGTYQVNVACAVALIAGEATFDDIYLEVYEEPIPYPIVIALLVVSIGGLGIYYITKKK